MPVSKRDVLAWFGALSGVFHENCAWLTDLDSAIGDADNGTNMERGFTALAEELTGHEPADIGALMRTAARVLIRTVGGAAGPLYGTFFLRAAPACSGKELLEAQDIVEMFEAGSAGIRQLGKAQPGDKTMLDALLPAVSAMRAALDSDPALASVLEAGAAAAQDGMLATVPMLARKGRASYLGPRSIGHQDPGATSAHLLIREAARVWGAAVPP